MKINTYTVLYKKLSYISLNIKILDTIASPPTKCLKAHIHSCLCDLRKYCIVLQMKWNEFIAPSKKYKWIYNTQPRCDHNVK